MNFLSYFDQILNPLLNFWNIKEHANDWNRKFNRSTEDTSL